ncbi:MAG: AMP-binding protein, partial [Propionibacteriaceae bacterium]|jgi:acyl-CoA synthetase (AMP-forming)/AMP-acid ligase II|nr:AMP-binding protein [Propionibacteriaceae bacterium]
MTETAGGVVYDGRPLPGVSLHLTDLDPWADLAPDGPALTGPAQDDPAPADLTSAGPTPADPAQNGLTSSGPDPTSADPTSTPAAPAWAVRPARPRPPGQVGRVVIVTPTCCLGYHGRPRDSAAVVAGSAFLTSDRGMIDPDGRLHLVGRVDQVVQSGGVDVDLDRLQDHLDQVFGPHRLVAFAAPDPRWGARVLVASRQAISLDRIERGLGRRVSAAGRPRGLLTVERWPRTESGKVDRRQLSLMWGEAGDGDGDAMD